MNPLAPESNTRLTRKIENANSVIKFSVAGVLAVALAMLVVVIMQLQAVQHQISQSLQENKAAGSANHAKTQRYVKCVAETLLKPIEERSVKIFDKCGLETDTKDPESSKPDAQSDPQPSNPAPSTSAEPGSPSPAATSEETTTTRPPAPGGDGTPTPPPATPQPSLLDSVLDGLGLGGLL